MSFGCGSTMADGTGGNLEVRCGEGDPPLICMGCLAVEESKTAAPEIVKDVYTEDG